MTEKEAVKVIRKELHSFCECSGIDCFNSDCENCKIILAYEKAIKALEKQIPKRAISIYKGNYNYNCPTCKNYINISDDDLYVYGIEPPKYCDECGQALDWGEKE